MKRRFLILTILVKDPKKSSREDYEKTTRGMMLEKDSNCVISFGHCQSAKEICQLAKDKRVQEIVFDGPPVESIKPIVSYLEKNCAGKYKFIAINRPGIDMVKNLSSMKELFGEKEEVKKEEKALEAA